MLLHSFPTLTDQYLAGSEVLQMPVLPVLTATRSHTTLGPILHMKQAKGLYPFQTKHNTGSVPVVYQAWYLFFFFGNTGCIRERQLAFARKQLTQSGKSWNSEFTNWVFLGCSVVFPNKVITLGELAEDGGNSEKYWDGWCCHLPLTTLKQQIHELSRSKLEGNKYKAYHVFWYF